MKTKFKWPVLTLLLAALAPLTAQPAHAGLFGLSQQDEVAAGKEVTKQALKEYGGAMPANHPYSRRVKAIGAQLARLSTRKGIPYSYTVLNDTKVLNAFAAPGGPIFVTRKLVETASNDAELAYVLGHETAHIERKHIVKQVEQQQKAGLVVGILGAILGGKGGNNDAIGAIASVGWTALSRGYSRQDENDADAYGVRFMSQLGYDPRAAITMLGKLGGGSGGGVSKYLATHPDPKDRQAKVRAQIESEKLVDVAKRHGGPRLASDVTDGPYTVVSDQNQYPGASTDAPVYYPPTSDDGGTPAYYPPTTAGSTDNELNFGAPIRLLAIDNGDNGVVMAPINGFARWAGATVNSGGDNTITVRRGNNWLELRRDSSQAKLNGRIVSMSAPVTSLNNILYAPLGHLASGVGATANLDSGARIVRISFEGRSGGFVRLPA